MPSIAETHSERFDPGSEPDIKVTLSELVDQVSANAECVLRCVEIHRRALFGGWAEKKESDQIPGDHFYSILSRALTTIRETQEHLNFITSN
jgi:hypothetical protein